MRLRIEGLAIRLNHKRSMHFSDIEWDFGNGGYLLVLRGDNGVGKTVLLNLISGYLCPDKGRVFLNDKQISGKGVSWAASHGVVRGFQSPVLCNELSVQENVSLALCKFWWKFTRIIKPNLDAVLKETGLEFCKEYSPAELSFGYRRLVELARIRLQLASSAKSLLLLDEPFAGLDNNHRNLTWGILQDFLSQNKSIILVEHDRELPLTAHRSREVELVANAAGCRDFVASGD